MRQRLVRSCRWHLFFIVFSVFFLLPPSLWAWQGTVTRVIDGNSLEVQHGREKVRVDLYGIAAPNVRQPGGQDAGIALRRLLLGKRVRVEEVETDRNRRTLALVYRGNTLVNREMVRLGHAWAYPDSCKQQPFCREVKDLERGARKQHSGFWGKDRNPQPPWEWKGHNGRDDKKDVRPPVPSHHGRDSSPSSGPNQPSRRP